MEIWKDIPNYEGLYQASNLGKIKSLSKNRRKYSKILKNKITKDGYYETALYKNGTAKFIRTHRLIALTFIPNFENKEQINHINGNKLDNRVNNLEWCTNQENIDHAIRTGLENFIGENNPKAKSIIQYDLKGNEIARYKTIRDAQNKLNIKESNISQVCNKHRKTTGGYIFKFESEVV